MSYINTKKVQLIIIFSLVFINILYITPSHSRNAEFPHSGNAMGDNALSPEGILDTRARIEDKFNEFNLDIQRLVSFIRSGIHFAPSLHFKITSGTIDGDKVYKIEYEPNGEMVFIFDLDKFTSIEMLTDTYWQVIGPQYSVYISKIYGFILDPWKAYGSEAAQQEMSEYMRMFDHFFIRGLKIDFNDNVLDMGTGFGCMGIIAAKYAMNGQVIGIDLSARGFDTGYRIAENIRANNISFQQADASDLENTFDEEEFNVVISQYMFAHLPRQMRRNILKQAHRVLKCRGKLGLCVYLPESQETAWTKQEWQKELQQCGFEIRTMRELPDGVMIITAYKPDPITEIILPKSESDFDSLKVAEPVSEFEHKINDLIDLIYSGKSPESARGLFFDLMRQKRQFTPLQCLNMGVLLLEYYSSIPESEREIYPFFYEQGMEFLVRAKQQSVEYDMNIQKRIIRVMLFLKLQQRHETDILQFFAGTYQKKRELPARELKEILNMFARVPDPMDVLFELMQKPEFSIEIIQFVDFCDVLIPISRDVFLKIFNFLAPERIKNNYIFEDYISAGMHGFVFKVREKASQEFRAIKITLVDNKYFNSPSEYLIRKKVMEIQKQDPHENLIYIYDNGVYQHPQIGRTLYSVAELVDVKYEFAANTLSSSFVHMDLNYDEIVQVMSQFLDLIAYFIKHGVLIVDQEIAIRRDSNGNISIKLLDLGAGALYERHEDINNDSRFKTNVSCMLDNLINYVLFKLLAGHELSDEQIGNISTMVNALAKKGFAQNIIIKDRISEVKDLAEFLKWFYYKDAKITGPLKVNSVINYVCQWASENSLADLIQQRSLRFFTAPFGLNDQSKANPFFIQELLLLYKAGYRGLIGENFKKYAEQFDIEEHDELFLEKLMARLFMYSRRLFSVHEAIRKAVLEVISKSDKLSEAGAKSANFPENHGLLCAA